MGDTDVNKTGESVYRRAGVSFDRVTFNGNRGIFFLQDKDAEKDEKTGKYPKTQLTEEGQPLNVVFLKIRRVLSSYAKKDGKYAGMRTSEHNHKNERVVLYAPNGKEYGIAADLRIKYPALHTQQLVYAYLPESETVVRLTIKGASLGSDFKHPKGVLKFYEYLQSFGKDESSSEFVTALTPVKEEGPQGEYYAMQFVKGEKIDPEMHAHTRRLIDEIHDEITASDERLRAGFGKDSVETIEEPNENDDEESDGIPYPKGDIKPDDIPF